MCYHQQESLRLLEDFPLGIVLTTYEPNKADFVKGQLWLFMSSLINQITVRFYNLFNAVIILYFEQSHFFRQFEFKSYTLLFLTKT